MKNYIEFFYDENDYLTAKIHKNGKVKTITDGVRLDKLITLCKKRGYTITGEKTIRRSSAEKITKDYDNYVKRIKRLEILGEITSNMRLSFKSKAIGRTITAFALAGTITMTGISLVNQIQKEKPSNTEREYYATHISRDDEQNSEAIYLNDNDLTLILDEIDKEQNTKQELESMFQEDAFHFSYENRVNNEAYQNTIRYEDLFEKYANMYGVDKNLLIAIASQESAGDHYNHLDGGPAIGIMQIEKGPNIGSTVEVYNFELGRKEKIEITEEKLKDLEQNIKIGAALVRYNIVYNDYNISIGVQNYNMGFGNMGQVLSACSESENTTIEDLKNNQTNNSWLDYRNAVSAGDSQYLEHVFSYIPTDSAIKVKDTFGNEYSLKLSNDYINETEKTNF